MSPSKLEGVAADDDDWADSGVWCLCLEVDESRGILSAWLRVSERRRKYSLIAYVGAMDARVTTDLEERMRV